jgi:hypothetical protein
MERCPVDLARVREALAVQYPMLHLVGGAVVPRLRGSIAITDETRELTWFAVEIDLAPVTTGGLPTVRETGGRIPWIIDRHVLPDGSACVCLPADYFLRHPGPFDLLAFLDGPVRGYFVGQALVEQGEPWPQGEWRHGTAGRDDWFKEFLDGLSAQQWSAYLETLAVRELKGHLTCPCGSGRRVRHCHLPLLRLLGRAISPESARELLGRVRSSSPSVR